MPDNLIEPMDGSSGSWRVDPGLVGKVNHSCDPVSVRSVTGTTKLNEFDYQQVNRRTCSLPARLEGDFGGDFVRRNRSRPIHPRIGQPRQVKKVHRLGSCGSMKLNMLVGSLMLGSCLCTPSFGGGLLDRMLGLKGSGCDSACCDTGCSADPSCGCELSACGNGCEPSCGVEMSDCGNCDSGRKFGGLFRSHKGHAAPSCGCEMSACGADPSCGCEVVDPSCGCEIAACGDGCGAAPSCGCEIAACDPCGCDTGCAKPRRKPLLELLGKLEAKKHALFARKSGCDSGCGCGADPSCGCEVVDPSCGCEIAACGDGCGAAPSCGCEIAACGPAACDSGCGAKKCGGLLSKLFAHKSKKAGCDAGCDTAYVSSGCSSCAGSAAPIAAPAVSGDAAPMPPAPIVDPSAYLQSNRRVIQATSYVR